MSDFTLKRFIKKLIWNIKTKLRPLIFMRFSCCVQKQNLGPFLYSTKFTRLTLTTYFKQCFTFPSPPYHKFHVPFYFLTDLHNSFFITAIVIQIENLNLKFVSSPTTNINIFSLTTINVFPDVPTCRKFNETKKCFRGTGSQLANLSKPLRKLNN